MLLSLRAGRGNTQRELADAVGVRGATLSHHLDGLEREGLVARRPDPDNRRIQRVELTPGGEQAFDRLRKVAMAFDQRLRQGLDEAEVDALRDTLERMQGNVAGDDPAWPGGPAATMIVAMRTIGPRRSPPAAALTAVLIAPAAAQAAYAPLDRAGPALDVPAPPSTPPPSARPASPAPGASRCCFRPPRASHADQNYSWNYERR